MSIVAVQRRSYLNEDAHGPPRSRYVKPQRRSSFNPMKPRPGRTGSSHAANMQSGRLFCALYAGLGDTIYLRPFAKALIETGRWKEAYVETAWPQLFDDMPEVKFVRHHEDLRTQQKNMNALSDTVWSKKPSIPYAQWKPVGFWTGNDSVIDTLIKQTPIDPAVLNFDYPDFGPPLVEPPYAMIRPVTVRGEWANPARNPDPQYVYQAAVMLKEAGYKIVSVADVDPPHENLIGDVPPADVSYHKGELDIRKLLALTRHASVVMGPVGWIVPATLAAHVPAIIIGGGSGHANAPEKIAPAIMDTSVYRQILPDNFCRNCRSMAHACPKEISNFEEQFEAALAEVTKEHAVA